MKIDLRDDGILWLINRALLHPRGYALAVQVGDSEDGELKDGDLLILGDGTEPWRYGSSVDEDALFAKAEGTLARATVENRQ